MNYAQVTLGVVEQISTEAQEGWIAVSDLVQEGYVYNEQLGIYHEQQQYLDWTLNTETLKWECPVPKPNDNSIWSLNTSTMAWAWQTLGD